MILAYFFVKCYYFNIKHKHEATIITDVVVRKPIFPAAPITTTHSIARYKVKTVLLDINLFSKEVTKFTVTPEGYEKGSETKKQANNIKKQRKTSGDS